MAIIDTSQSIFDFRVTGQVNLKLYNKYGEIIDERESKNLVVDTGKTYIASRIASNTAAIVSYMGIGTSNTYNASSTVGVSASDTNLTTQAASSTRVAVTPTATGNQVSYTGVFVSGNGGGDIKEAALFSAASGGIMLARTTFGIITKVLGSDQLTLTWTLTVS